MNEKGCVRWQELSLSGSTFQMTVFFKQILRSPSVCQQGLRIQSCHVKFCNLVKCQRVPSLTIIEQKEGKTNEKGAVNLC